MLNNENLVIPKNKRIELLDQLHEYHGGAEISYNLAREHWYWQTMKSQITQLSLQCEKCEMNKRQKPRPLPIPESHIADLLPLKELNINSMQIEHYNYLCISCRATGFLFCFRTENLNTQTVTKAFESKFNQFGLTDKICCNNAGAFRDTFRAWAENLSIRINHSSPKNSESNGGIYKEWYFF